MMFTWSLTAAIIDTITELEQGVTAAVHASPHTQGLLTRVFGWLLPGLPALTARNQAAHCYQTLCHDLPSVFKQGALGAPVDLGSRFCCCCGANGPVSFCGGVTPAQTFGLPACSPEQCASVTLCLFTCPFCRHTPYSLLAFVPGASSC